MVIAWVWILGVIWGGVYPLIKLAVVTIPPLTTALAQTGIAAIALLVAVAVSTRDWRRLRARAPQLLLMGILNNVLPETLLAWSLRRIDSGLAAILIATMPTFTLGLAWTLPPRVRPTPGQIGGIALGLAGVLILVGPFAWHGLGDSVLGQCAVLGAALSYAGAAAYGRRLNDLSPLSASAGQLAG